MRTPRPPRPDQKLRELVAQIIDQQQGRPRISPNSVANEAIHHLDQDRSVEHDHPLIWLGCHLELRQIARQVLAQRFLGDDGERQEPLFIDLQWRYPAARSADQEEPEYVLRDLMSEEDIAYNVARLRAEAEAKQKHADALEAWGRNRQRAG